MAFDSESSQNSAAQELARAAQKQKAEMLADEDPLLISQSLTYVTDDGSVLHSFHSAPFSTSKWEKVNLCYVFTTIIRITHIRKKRLQNSNHHLRGRLYRINDCGRTRRGPRNGRRNLPREFVFVSLVLVQFSSIGGCDSRWNTSFLDRKH